ncbi:invasion associated locus B family protein [Nitrospirillum sp. BR 11163]|uniref:invasion associated locus B family protein n=1 Tax=Nitrospirillum sp. BR 11163 TaxID=3104323 RepID=UPI002AFDE2BA|nr:invasion associated locus B family protein [Nitrospirillum sp. BR 11163]MEA1676416.1 invasion associated locus B family protein [Nitrospirillum sp. BR 11163]
MTNKEDPAPATTSTGGSRTPLIVIGLLLLLGLLTVGGIMLYQHHKASSAKSAAATAEAQKPAGPPWAKNCAKDANGGDVCYVEQFAIANPGNTIVLHVQIGYMSADGKPVLVITVPLGTPVQPGLQLTLDGAKPIALPLTLCQQGGCVASANLDQDVLKQFTTGTVLMVRYAKPDKTAMDVPVQLAGLAPALQSLGPPPAPKPADAAKAAEQPKK